MTVPEINYIDSELMKIWCHPFAVALFDSSVEPMTAFDSHDNSLLESALASPRQSYDGKDLYPTIEEKAAILYYGLIKNHPFQNGNKRTATATLLVFLYINNFWIEGDSHNENYFVELATDVARSAGNAQKSIFLEKIRNFLKEKMYHRENE
jgi:death-on-curing family protein